MRAVLFDFAGTLFMPRWTDQLVLEAARSLGLDLSGQDCARLAGECLRAGVPGGPYPAELPDELVDVYEQRDLFPHAHRSAYVGLLSTAELPHPELAARLYDQILQPAGWMPYSDARAVIDELAARGIRLGLISNVGFDVRPILRAHGFEQLAECCTLSYEVGVIKPDPEIFRAALEKLGTDAGAALMVGDHPVVDRGGELLGIRTLILPMGPPGSEHGLEAVLDVLGDGASSGGGSGGAEAARRPPG